MYVCMCRGEKKREKWENEHVSRSIILFLFLNHVNKKCEGRRKGFEILGMLSKNQTLTNSIKFSGLNDLTVVSVISQSKHQVTG